MTRIVLFALAQAMALGIAAVLMVQLTAGVTSPRERLLAFSGAAVTSLAIAGWKLRRT